MIVSCDTMIMCVDLYVPLGKHKVGKKVMAKPYCRHHAYTYEGDNSEQEAMSRHGCEAVVSPKPMCLHVDAYGANFDHVNKVNDVRCFSFGGNLFAAERHGSKRQENTHVCYHRSSRYTMFTHTQDVYTRTHIHAYRHSA